MSSTGEETLQSTLIFEDNFVFQRTSTEGDFLAPSASNGDLVGYRRVPARKDGNCLFQSVLSAHGNKICKAEKKSRRCA